MAVPTWKRQESQMSYLHNMYELEKELYQMIANAPKKYTDSIGKAIVLECDEALRNGKIAQNLFPFYDKEIIIQRRYHLTEAKSNIDVLCTHVYIWIDLMAESDSMTLYKKEKMYRRRQRIGEKCIAINKGIEGLMSSDLHRWNDSHPNNKLLPEHSQKFDVVIHKLIEIMGH